MGWHAKHKYILIIKIKTLSSTRRSARNGEITFVTFYPTRLRVVLPDDTFVLGFHLQLSSGLCRSYIPIRYTPIKYNIPWRRQKCDLPRAARNAGPILHRTLKVRAFPVAAAHTWNSLPEHIVSAPTLQSFGCHLKTFLLQ